MAFKAILLRKHKITICHFKVEIWGEEKVIFWHSVNCLILGIIATVLLLAFLF